jgi:hypothetical protein
MDRAMRQRRGFKYICSELGVPTALLKILIPTLIFPLFGFHAWAENLWLDNWFWVPVTYFCVITSLSSIALMLALMLIKNNKDLRKVRERP